MVAALLVAHVNVVSWPATTVCGLADNEIEGPAAGGFGGVGGEGGVRGFSPLPTDLVSGVAEPAPPQPLQRMTPRIAAKRTDGRKMKRGIFTTSARPVTLDSAALARVAGRVFREYRFRSPALD